jgi:hypothetical protein
MCDIVDNDIDTRIHTRNHKQQSRVVKRDVKTCLHIITCQTRERETINCHDQTIATNRQLRFHMRHT